MPEVHLRTYWRLVAEGGASAREVAAQRDWEISSVNRFCLCSLRLSLWRIGETPLGQWFFRQIGCKKLARLQ
ncbi:MAG: hypothetical protein CMM07_29585 [Rhodopirellula sp.]|nr:hypothetical protein [Rhodopirellula sp.]